MSYRTSPTAHATFSDSTTQTVASTSVAYPITLDTNDDVEGITHDISGTTCSISIATPCVVTLSGHGFFVGSVVQFSTTIALPTGLTADTKYYVISAGFTSSQFEISTSPGGAAVNTSGSQSGTQKVRSTAQIKFKNPGVYSLALSIVCDTTSNTAAILDVWIRLNGSNYARSNTQVAINSSNQQQVLAVTIIGHADNIGDIIEIMYHATSTNTRLLAVAEQTGPPTIPACPSVIAVLSKISAE